MSVLATPRQRGALFLKSFSPFHVLLAIISMMHKKFRMLLAQAKGDDPTNQLKATEPFCQNETTSDKLLPPHQSHIKAIKTLPSWFPAILNTKPQIPHKAKIGQYPQNTNFRFLTKEALGLKRFNALYLLQRSLKTSKQQTRLKRCSKHPMLASRAMG